MYALAVMVSAVLGAEAVESATRYPRSEMLLEAGELLQPGAGAKYVILDARARKAFDEGRIPGARWVDASAWAKAFGQGSDAAAWSKRIGGLGIGRDSRVVVYDASSFRDAARVWWILGYWGVGDVRLLNGGWTLWHKVRLPVETGKCPEPQPAPFQAVPRTQRLATKDLLLESLKQRSLQIVDARSEREFCGLEKEKNKRAGAIPGAKHLEWVELVDQPCGRFKTLEQLRKLFQDAGIDLQKPSAAHCQSGGRSSVMVFAMELMGAKDVRNYHASWAEWGNADDTPIVSGQPKARQ